ncbi:MAG: hypothetical protein MZV63_70600 [Marinilabiliales bacterium]|nr:hypothetical protein [Marinilabiliales bacterium]
MPSTGEVLMDVVPPDNLILQRPAWSSDGRAVTVVTLSAERRRDKIIQADRQEMDRDTCPKALRT